jgi:hypothetical protein
MEKPASSYAAANIALRMTTQAPPLRQSRDTIRGKCLCSAPEVHLSTTWGLVSGYHSQGYSSAGWASGFLDPHG